MRSERLREVTIPTDILIMCADYARRIAPKMKQFDAMPSYARAQARQVRGRAVVRAAPEPEEMGLRDQVAKDLKDW